MRSVSRLESIYKDLEQEHREVMKQLERLRSSVSTSEVLPLLEELRTLLIVHFAREQLPDGFYDALSDIAESRSAELKTLIAEHAAILSHLNKTLSSAKASGTKPSDVLDGVSKLLQQLDEHERKEHQFAVDVLGSEADTH